MMDELKPCLLFQQALWLTQGRKLMNPNTLTVLFDGGCPLCSREIAHYQQLTSRMPIDWVDITQDRERLRSLGLSVAEAMAEFHVIDGSGQVYKGADGFVALWQALPYFHWLASLCKTLHLLPLMRWGYAHFARWHYRRRCQAGVCG